MVLRIFMPFLLMAFLTVSGCQKQVTGIEFNKLYKGEYWYDVFLVNKSGTDLHDVKATITLLDKEGVSHSDEKHYEGWTNGTMLKLSVKAEGEVQEISLAGSCREGLINSSWRRQ